MKDSIDIRWHGRRPGCHHRCEDRCPCCSSPGIPEVAMVPSVRNAGVHRYSTSLKDLEEQDLYDLSPAERPDIIVVLDHVLLEEGSITNGTEGRGDPGDQFPVQPRVYHHGDFTVAVCDVQYPGGQGRAPRGAWSTRASSGPLPARPAS